MLILTRRAGESIVIGDEIYCTVLGIKGNQVRLGFDAAKSVSIHRLEIHERIKLNRELNESKDNEDIDLFADTALIDALLPTFKNEQCHLTSPH